VTTIAYDARGYKLWMFDPDMGLNSVSDRWEYVHNAFGELVQQTDAKNQVVTLEYDDAGRLEERHEPEGTTYFTYYPHNAPTAGHAGRLQQTTSPGSLSEVFEYHPTHGAVTQITRSIGASSYELDFSFDTQGRLSQITYPTNVDAQRLGVEYLYDGWGALWQVRNAATPSLVYYTLNEQNGSGAERRVTLGNGVVEQYGYEATTGRLESIQTGPAGSATLQNLSYEWDLAGNLEQRVDQLLSRTELFNYDALDRLASVVRNSSTIFSLTYNNLIGNISSKTDSSGTFAYSYGSSRPHAVTAFGTMTFGYDLNGNMTSRNGGAITWTSYNLPSRIERSSGEYSEFLYGADRSRYRQIEGSGALSSTRHYASPGLFEVLTWNGGASRVDYHYIHANGRAVAQFTTSNVEADELQYLHRDHQGSVVATTSTSGAVLDRFEYDAFGKRTTTVGNDDRMHRGYTGHEHLEALDLIHMNGRVQDPVIGRFLSPDPFVQAPYHSQSLNRYSYVWNNPLSLVDPSGFQTDERLPPVPCELTLSREHGSWTCQGPNLPPIVDEERNHSPSVDGGDGGGYAFAHVNTPVPYTPLGSPLPHCDAQLGCFGAGATLHDVMDRVRGLQEEAAADVSCVLAGAGCDVTERVLKTAMLLPAARPLKVVSGIAKFLGLEGVAARGVAADAKFAQATFSRMFSQGGTFAGKSVDEVAAALRSGAMKASDVPINYIVRDGQTIILNTRSAQALEAAGIPRAQWNGVNQTGNSFFENLLNGQLGRNPGGPFDTVRPGGP
jgi:RHS repeat-associated protein